jgi:magnesium transporter
MLKVYQRQNGGLKGALIPEGDALPADAVWIDLFNPTPEERRMVGKVLGLEMPSRADMEEIEVSSRIYQEEGGTFMTALVMANAESERPVADVVTFVLAQEKLVTLRYIDPQPFRTFAARCERGGINVATGELALTSLLDVIVDRMADILERMGAEVENVSREIFGDHSAKPMVSADFQNVLRILGRKHDLSGKMRECLLTLSRMMSFLNQAMDDKKHRDVRAHVKTLTRDIQSLQDHASYMSGKMSYLQDATLGLINIDQNNIIKIMSVAAMVFLPPTLFASVWGMNFHHMPEMDEVWGYPVAIVVMVISAVLPYWYFKRRGWL